MRPNYALVSTSLLIRVFITAMTFAFYVIHEFLTIHFYLLFCDVLMYFLHVDAFLSYFGGLLIVLIIVMIHLKLC